MPDSRPVDASKPAQTGRFCTAKDNVAPSGSEALGWNAYACPAITAPEGEPLMTGGSSTRGVVPSISIVNAGSAALICQSLTPITTSE